MEDQRLGVEKARLLSLAIEFGFDEQSANKCLDRLGSLYGTRMLAMKVASFVTMEHCGDEFLAELAVTTQDTENWDDLHAAKSEACGVPTDMFVQDISNGSECNVMHDVNMVEDSPRPIRNQVFLEVDSSVDSEDEDDILGSKMGRKWKSTYCIPDQISTPSNSSTQLLAERYLESMVCF